MHTMTHYHADSTTAFELGACEACGGAVQEPNAVKMGHLDARKLDLQEWDAPLPLEIGAHDDGTAHCGCRDKEPEVGDQVAVETKDGGFRMGRINSIIKGWYEIQVDEDVIKARRKQIEVIPAPVKQKRPKGDSRPGVVAISHSGRKTIHNGDSLAKQMEGMNMDEVYAFTAKLLDTPASHLRNSYSHLNLGQQRMCCGNKLRGAQKRGEI